MQRETLNFTTQVAVPPLPFGLDYANSILLMGSCFAENIGRILHSYKFCVEQNPFGILYNPSSVLAAMKRLMQPEAFTEADLVASGGVFHSWDHHSRFSATTPETCIDSINDSLAHAADFFKKADTVLLTWGTAYVYFLKGTNRLVANCHKQPESLFERKRLTVEEIVEEWTAMLTELLGRKPHIRIVLTVSPIRHWKDGAHGNQLSKAILLLAIDRLCERFPANIAYFPAYEIVMDELRDYRFYADDMLHPSPLAVQYIWSRFQEVAISPAAGKTMKEVDRIQKALSHRPFHPQSDSHRRFVGQTLKQMDHLSKAEGIDFCAEKESLLRQLDPKT